MNGDAITMRPDRTRRTVAATALGLALLTGCTAPQPESVDDYVTHAEARREMRRRCQEKNPGLRLDADCTNAREAEDQVAAKRDLERQRHGWGTTAPRRPLTENPKLH